MGNLSIRRIEPQQSRDLWVQLARLHRDEIGGGLLSSFGADFLVQMYASLANSPRVILFVATPGDEPNRIVGFICGSTDTRAAYRDVLLRDGFRFIPFMFRWLLSWKTITRIGETLLHPYKLKARDLPRAQILNFCVTVTEQSKGVGRALFTALISEMRERGVRECKILTGEMQTKAQLFYKSVHAKQVDMEEVHKGTRSVIYLYTLTDRESEGIKR